MYIHRDLQKTLSRYVSFPVIAILGPRQSGKTTLAQQYFPRHRYVSFEDPVIREYALQDPEGFLREYHTPDGIILDEFQYVPSILSYIQLQVDRTNQPGYFVLTGSQNFLANQAITQSLAGRVGIVTLLPFSLHELQTQELLPEYAQDLIIKGSYPRLYTSPQKPADAYAAYIHTYIERDVRQLINVGDLRTFHRFITLCAGRAGNVLNVSDIAENCGISAPTADRWLSVLEASYIIFLVQPHFRNFNKRLIKAPKLYFYDTGIICSLLGISTTSALMASPFKGPLFENLIMSDLHKQYFNKGITPPLYFWRDHNGRIEVDAIIDYQAKLIPIEIKSSETIAYANFFDGLARWNEMSGTPTADNYVVYGGSTDQNRTAGHIRSWRSAGNLVAEIFPDE